jgi:RNA polymerase primary sigma factor
LGRDPLAEEIALEMGVDVEKIYQIEKIDQDTVSLESPVGSDDDDGKSVLGDFIKDDKILLPTKKWRAAFWPTSCARFWTSSRPKSARF